jgi:hypothetical protein
MGCKCRVCVCGCVHQYTFVETLRLLSATQGQPSVVGLLPTDTASTPAPNAHSDQQHTSKVRCLGASKCGFKGFILNTSRGCFAHLFKLARTPSQACALDQ